ncbi:hypothetical protein BKA93DRAFT_753674 [Sparassis latifolia]
MCSFNASRAYTQTQTHTVDSDLETQMLPRARFGRAPPSSARARPQSVIAKGPARPWPPPRYSSQRAPLVLHSSSAGDSIFPTRDNALCIWKVLADPFSEIRCLVPSSAADQRARVVLSANSSIDGPSVISASRGATLLPNGPNLIPTVSHAIGRVFTGTSTIAPPVLLPSVLYAFFTKDNDEVSCICTAGEHYKCAKDLRYAPARLSEQTDLQRAQTTPSDQQADPGRETYTYRRRRVYVSTYARARRRDGCRNPILRRTEALAGLARARGPSRCSGEDEDACGDGTVNMKRAGGSDAGNERARS